MKTYVINNLPYMKNRDRGCDNFFLLKKKRYIYMLHLFPSVRMLQYFEQESDSSS